MDTILYIVIAVAIMAYQVYSEKNKKEQKKRVVNQPPVPQVDSNEELDSELATMFDSLSNNGSEEVGGKHKATSNDKIEAQAYNIDVPVNKSDEENRQLLKDIYDSDQITNFDSNKQGDSESEMEAEKFDPRLFILYSEIAKPKFMD